MDPKLLFLLGIWFCTDPKRIILSTRTHHCQFSQRLVCYGPKLLFLPGMPFTTDPKPTFFSQGLGSSWALHHRCSHWFTSDKQNEHKDTLSDLHLPVGWGSFACWGGSRNTWHALETQGKQTFWQKGLGKLPGCSTNPWKYVSFGSTMNQIPKNNVLGPRQTKPPGKTEMFGVYGEPDAIVTCGHAFRRLGHCKTHKGNAVQDMN